VTGGATPLDYAAWRESTLGRVTERLERAVVLELAGPCRGIDLLDVGAGDGAYALPLAKVGTRVTALDPSVPALRVVAGRARDSGSRLVLVAGGAEALPFEAGTFDLAIAVTVLCSVRAPQQAVCEIARVLRPGGRLVIGELGQWSTWAAVRRVRGALGAATWRDARFFTPRALRQLVENAGLVPGRVSGAVFHPPLGVAAAAFAPFDPLLGRATTFGAAFLALEASK
jgi:ubiquinone/menaquinone biosynthesis C-methylase UbiE